MAVSVFTLLGGSEKNMGNVHSGVKALALELVKRAYHNGTPILITSGLRTAAEQNRLYAQGRYGNPGSIVTNAQAGQSVHNYGYAVDYALVTDKGYPVWDLSRDTNDDNQKDWFEVAAVAKGLGFKWGGDWTSFKDYPHIDIGGLTWQQLQAGRRPKVPAVPDRDYMGPGDAAASVGTLQGYLNKLGFKCDVDDAYGPGTEEAVKAFQKQYGLSVDGLYGPGTQNKLHEVLDALNKPKAEIAAAKEEIKVEQPEGRYEPIGGALGKEWEEAYKAGITDGSNPNEPLTRAEGAAMVLRAVKALAVEK